MPSISVIVPVYKVEDYLSRCIDSILNQTFTDFELILVDDGSPDRCGEICDQYALIDTRVKVIHQPNSGASSARNNGVKAAVGDYVAFIDSDDWVDINYLKCLYDLCVNNGAQLSVCNLKQTDRYYIDNIKLEHLDTEIMSGDEALHRYIKQWDTRIRGPVVKLIKRDIVLNNPFPIDRKISEDAACVYKWFFEAETVAVTGAELYYYYFREGSTMHSGIDRSRLDTLKTYNEMMYFFTETGLLSLAEQVMVFSFVDIAKYYEICKAENNLEDAEVIKKAFDAYVKKWLLISCDMKDVQNREDIIPLIKNKLVQKEYIQQCIKSMAIHLNYKDYGRLLNMKPRLKKVLLNYHPSISSNTYAYGSIFPKSMELYWRIKGVVNHFKKIKNGF